MKTGRAIVILVSVLALAAAVAVAPKAAHAQTTVGSNLSQDITAGPLSTSVRSETGTVVASPSFDMGSVTVSTSRQTATGVFGSNTQRISVDNPGGANGGWTLSLNATTPGTGRWTSGGNNYPYNGTAVAGRLTVNPSDGMLTSAAGTSTGITRGTSAAFSSSTPVTVMTASAASDDIWNGYITGVSLTQTIPAAQPAGEYMLSVTQTVAAT